MQLGNSGGGYLAARQINESCVNCVGGSYRQLLRDDGFNEGFKVSSLRFCSPDRTEGAALYDRYEFRVGFADLCYCTLHLRM